MSVRPLEVSGPHDSSLTATEEEIVSDDDIFTNTINNPHF
jgi:hypothetical protein